MTKIQTTFFDSDVSERIRRLLESCDRIRRGSDIDRPITFNAAGEAHARQVARRDRQGEADGVVAKRPAPK